MVSNGVDCKFFEVCGSRDQQPEYAALDASRLEQMRVRKDETRVVKWMGMQFAPAMHSNY